MPIAFHVHADVKVCSITSCEHDIRLLNTGYVAKVWTDAADTALRGNSNLRASWETEPPCAPSPLIRHYLQSVPGAVQHSLADVDGLRSRFHQVRPVSRRSTRCVPPLPLPVRRPLIRCDAVKETIIPAFACRRGGLISGVRESAGRDGVSLFP